jgi:hypothetical protein
MATGASLHETEPDEEVASLLNLGSRELIEALRLDHGPQQISWALDWSSSDLRGAQGRRTEAGISGFVQTCVIAIVMNVWHDRLLSAALGCCVLPAPLD